MTFKHDIYKIGFKVDTLITIDIFQPHLEPFILQNLLNGHHLLAVDEASLVHHTKRAISNHL